MGKIAFVFSGQGAQHPGMGKDFYDNYEVAKKLFDNFENIKHGIKNLCFNGSEEELSQTKNTQPALYCVDIIASALLEMHGIKADVVAGFSLGELAALAYAKSFNENEGLQIVCKRGEYMQDCGKDFDSTMVAVLKSNNELIEKVCSNFKNVYPVNYNCSDQLVVSGLKSEIPDFASEMKKNGARVLPLSVSGGFHCPFMNSAYVKFKDYLSSISIDIPSIPVYSNYTSLPYSDDVKEVLANQIINPVLWQKSVENMIDDGIDTFIEVGTGKTLKKLISKINKDVKVFNVEDMNSLEITIQGVKNIEQ